VNTITAAVVDSAQLTGRLIETWLLVPASTPSARPGQFFMVDGSDGLDPFLRRSYPFYRRRQTADSLEIGLLYEATDQATLWLARRRAGDHVGLFGPLGNGFQVDPRTTNLLLLAHGAAVGPLVGLADEAVAAGRNVTLVAAASSEAETYPTHALPAEMEVVIMGPDELPPQPGPQAAHLGGLLAWADQVFVSGTSALYRSLASSLLRENFRRPVQVYAGERLPCGTGICAGCAIMARRGRLLICRDGPCFDLRDVV
jgi:dihydroorotate dehydrogenase electron transfer subunit